MASPPMESSTELPIENGPSSPDYETLVRELTLYVQCQQEYFQKEVHLSPDNHLAQIKNPSRRFLTCLYIRANQQLQAMDIENKRPPRPTILPTIQLNIDTDEYEPLWRDSKNLHKDRVCAYCFDPIEEEHNAVTLECLHLICRSCLLERINSAVKCEINFPVRCCNMDLDILAYGAHLDDVLYAEVRTKQDEYYTLIKDRVYCQNKQCSAYIASRQQVSRMNLGVIREKAHCGKCYTTTCTLCEQACDEETHVADHRCVVDNSPSGTDDPDRFSYEYSANLRVKNCPHCTARLELAEACNHMTCAFCGYEFCFVCLMSWVMVDFGDHHRCPAYNDPLYDEEGYSMDKMRIHLLDGRDRNGYDLAGLDRNGRNRYGGKAAFFRFKSRRRRSPTYEAFVERLPEPEFPEPEF